MSAVGTLDPGSSRGPPLLHAIEEAADVLRIGRTAYALARRYEETAGHECLPSSASATASVCRGGRCSSSRSTDAPCRSENSHPSAADARRTLDAELTHINQIGREADPEPQQDTPRVVELSGQARIRRAARPRSSEQLHLLPPS